MSKVQPGVLQRMEQGVALGSGSAPSQKEKDAVGKEHGRSICSAVRHVTMRGDLLDQAVEIRQQFSVRADRALNSDSAIAMEDRCHRYWLIAQYLVPSRRCGFRAGRAYWLAEVSRIPVELLIRQVTHSRAARDWISRDQLLGQV